MRRPNLAWMHRLAHRPGRIALVPLIGLALLLAACVGIVQPGQWAALSPADGHVVLSLADDPFDPNIVYAGSAGGLVYRVYTGNRSSSGGAAGQGIPDDADVDALVPDPATQQTIYAGTSDGLYVSTDRGDHWQPRGSGLPAGDTIDALAVTTPGGATPGDVLFAGTTAHGVLSSADGGRTWAQVTGGLSATANINKLFWEPQSQTLYAAADGVGVFASTDGGRSWELRNAGLSPRTFALAVLPDKAAPNGIPLLLAGTDHGVFSSADGGQHWAARGTNFANQVQALATDPLHASWLYAGTTSDVFRSQDGGVTWSALAPGISHAVSSLLAVAPTGQQTVVFAGAGPLQRYPPYLGSGDGQGSAALGTVMVVLLLAAIVFVFLRTRRMMIAADRTLPVGLQEPERPREDEPETASGGRYINAMTPPAAQNGHGRPPRGAVPGGTAGGEPRRRTEDGDGDRGDGRRRPSR